jgi:hypothetical protein
LLDEGLDIGRNEFLRRGLLLSGNGFVAAHALLQVAFWVLPALESRARIAIKNNMLS